ncbi:ATP-binding cassette domain-containing protein [Bacillus sp. CLL-7-23]|uniref:ATP-binding cassette domain-containing protein n=1 Tax=Bacillus changyiensis TaxID=3004103 RepID=A0ABT4WZ13_9BACI|nr:ATP-binding cassette domain-containing protein [Bacillus changyiensis]MDA7025122.1 ATP-binding cassette domain-containing protein [Bacillus changyiensis]
MCRVKDFALKTNQLTKQYKHNKALDNVNIHVKKGEIYGLIGMNGAGKTTLIRLLAGLIKPESGKIEIFGEEVERKKEILRRRIGWLIESPSLYLNRTAYENLEIERLHKGISEKSSIDNALKMVNLVDVKNKKTKEFSLGMKQRLGIAMALLGDPQILILDEPTNGLDPVGIADIRKMLQNLNKNYGITILISSHMLSELYQLAGIYGIVHKGKLIEEIKLEELNNRCQKYIHIKTNEVQNIVEMIKANFSTNNYKIIGNSAINLYDDHLNINEISSFMHENGIKFEGILKKGESLEDYYLNLIEGK